MTRSTALLLLSCARAITLAVRHPFDTATLEGRTRERERRMMLTTLASVGSRATSVMVSLATVPLALHYLGTEQYGLWLVLTSAVAWLASAQLGIAPSLLNAMAADGRDNSARGASLVATAWWLQAAIAGALIVILVVLLPILPLRALLNAGEGVDLSTVQNVAILLCVGFAIALPLQIANTTFQARQEGYLAHAWDTLRSLLRLAGVLWAIRADLGLSGFAVGYVLTPLIAGVAGALHAFGRRYRALAPRLRRVSWLWVSPLLRPGLLFTGLALSALVISSTDNIVIAHVLGPAHVPSYAVAYMLAQLFIMMEMLVLDAAWPAYVEAAAGGDTEWVRRTHSRLVRLLLAGAVVFGIAFIALGRGAIRLWAGETIVPPLSLVAIMALLVVVQSVQLCYGRLMTALGAVRMNMLLGFANAAINLPVSILLARSIGLAGVALGTVIGYVAAGVPLTILAPRALKVLGRPSGTRGPSGRWGVETAAEAVIPR
jgi:O-antigen/teichoic acid export membrane protein